MIGAVGSFFFGDGVGQFFAPELSAGKKLSVFLDEEQPELAIRMLEAEFPLKPSDGGGGAAAGFDAAAADGVVNFRDDPSGNRPLHYAAARGGAARMPDAVAALVARGARVDVANANGRTPLMFAAQRGHVPIVRALLAAGADAAAADALGRNAEELAASRFPDVAALVSSRPRSSPRSGEPVLVEVTAAPAPAPAAPAPAVPVPPAVEPVAPEPSAPRPPPIAPLADADAPMLSAAAAAQGPQNTPGAQNTPLARQASLKFSPSPKLERAHSDSVVLKSGGGSLRDAATAETGERYNEPGHWDFFLSHVQRETKDLAVDMYFTLQSHNKSVWLDVKMPQRNEAAMEEASGIFCSCLTLTAFFAASGCALFFCCDRAAERVVLHAPFLLEGDSLGSEVQCACPIVYPTALDCSSYSYKIPIIVGIPYELKMRIGALLETCPKDLRAIGSIDFISLDRSDTE